MACCPKMDGISVVGAVHSVGDTITIATLPKSFGWVGVLLNLRCRHRLFLRNRRRFPRLNPRLLRGIMFCHLLRLLILATTNDSCGGGFRRLRWLFLSFLFSKTSVLVNCERIRLAGFVIRDE